MCGRCSRSRIFRGEQEQKQQGQRGQTSLSELDSSASSSAARSRSFNSLYPAGFDDVSARFITLSSGVRVRVIEAGQHNSNPVVLVPGWGCGAWIFHDILPHLALSGFHAMAVELRGHGLSDKPDDKHEYTNDAMRDHLAEIVDALGLDRTHMIGHSMGAAIAAELAAAEPER